MRLSIESEQLSKENIQSLLQAIRDLEQAAFPEKDIAISLIVPDLNSKECEEIINSIRPPFGSGPITIEFEKK